jgi:hypothetical protein
VTKRREIRPIDLRIVTDYPAEAVDQPVGREAHSRRRLIRACS